MSASGAPWQYLSSARRKIAASQAERLKSLVEERNFMSSGESKMSISERPSTDSMSKNCEFGRGKDISVDREPSLVRVLERD